MVHESTTLTGAKFSYIKFSQNHTTLSCLREVHTANNNDTVQFSMCVKQSLVFVGHMISGGLAHRETGRFPGGPLFKEVFRAPGRTGEFISLIIS